MFWGTAEALVVLMFVIKVKLTDRVAAKGKKTIIYNHM